MRKRVELDKTFLERLSTSPRKAVSELIWNALDADADRIQVALDMNELRGITAIRVTDDGHGMTAAEVDASFGRLGGSWKATASSTRTKGRALHGREGRGRFLAAKIAGHISWESVAVGADGQLRGTTVDIYRSALDSVEIRDDGATTAPTGTTVTLTDFDTAPAGLQGPAVADGITGEFALNLTKYPVEVTYDGIPIDPKALQTSMTTYPLDLPGGGGHLDVVEWKKPMERRLFLCDDNGIALSQLQAGVQAPGFDFTAYVRWEGFVADGALDLAELSGGPTGVVVEAAREKLRVHFRERARDHRREVIAAWQRDEVYPYATASPSTEVERTARELFDIVAFTAHDAVGTDKRTQKFTLRLLREALEQDPGQLRRVLEEVLDLDQDRLADLNLLLDRTSLAAIVSAAKAITGRLDFLRGLDEIVFEPEVRGRVLERSQLHRMLATETWLFGEQYHLLADDESLTTVLRRHMEHLDRDDIAPEKVTDEDGRTRIVDLMLAKSLEHAQSRRDHLVIELKRPIVKVGHKEVAQIRDYAQAVADDPQFDKAGTQWDFWVISTELDDTVKRQANQRNREPGLLDDYEGMNLRIWAKTWAQVMQEARHRLKFVRDQLEYASTRDHAVQHLHERHREFVPEPLRAVASMETDHAA